MLGECFESLQFTIGSPFIDNRTSSQRRSKHQKVGGAPFRGALVELKGYIKISPEMFATGEGGGGRDREGKVNAIINQRPLRLTHG